MQKKGKTFFVMYVHGNENYGVNSFLNNGDGTIYDLATGLMRMKEDSNMGMNWEDAFGYAEKKNLPGTMIGVYPILKNFRVLVIIQKHQRQQVMRLI